MATDQQLMKSESILVTGGARSGKSRFAETRLKSFQKVVFLATAEGLDEEMSRRIERHRRRRPATWSTIEEPIKVPEVLKRILPEADAVLVDCLTLWISNLIGAGWSDERIHEAVEELAELLDATPCPLVVVTNEVGSGIVPANPTARRYRDLVGAANQRLARSADRVYWMVSGLPVTVK